MGRSQVTAERVGDRIHLIGWLGENTPDLCKAVGGGRFSKAGGAHWAYPLDLGVCRRLREVFTDQLVIGPELRAWAWAARQTEDRLQNLSTARDAELRWLPELFPVADAAMASRSYQRAAVAFGAEAGSFGLFDQPGLGKTLETLGAIVEQAGPDASTPRRHLVFAPSVAVTAVWAPEVQRWLGSWAEVFPVVGSASEREAILQAALRSKAQHVFVIANIEMTRIKPQPKPDGGKPDFPIHNAAYPALFSVEWDTIIVDESHRALIRTKGVSTQQRAGFTQLRSKNRIALSGTPMRGKPEQLWGTLNWLRPDLFTSYWKWVERYFELSSNGYSDYVIGDFLDGAEEKMQRDLSSIVLRRTKAEVLPELPPKTYAGYYLIPDNPKSPFGVWLPLEGKHRKQYQEFEKEGALSFENDELIAHGPLAEYTRKSQLANGVWKKEGGKFVPTLESPKWDWLVQKISELGIPEGEGDAKIVVASKSTALLNVFHAGLTELGVAAFLLTGETPEKSRAKMVESFQTRNDVRVFMLNIKAGGVAVTLDAADDLVLLDETTVPDDTEQVEDRLHRTSRIHNVTIHILRTLDTQDEEIAWVAAARENIQKYLLDGTRGVEAARKLFFTKT